jgi:plastocyanin
MQQLTYCYGPLQINPGQNIIRLNATNLFPQVPGYITRFDPELVYEDGTVPAVDVLHLHLAVWLVNLNPQFAVGEEKTIVQLPRGFGYRSSPSDSWLVNDMIHDLTGQAASVYIVWRIDFVPDTVPAAASIKPIRTRWLDVSGIKFYPVFDAVRGMGSNGKYTFPDQATGEALQDVGPAAKWDVTRPQTLIAVAGHLHPGGLYTDLKVVRGTKVRRIFRSKAKYWEPAGAVSWDVAMTGTTPDWRVKVQPGDQVRVSATYRVSNADWYESMGIMPVAVYDGTDVGGGDAIKGRIRRKGVLTHGHLAENDNHGGKTAGLPDPRLLPSIAVPGSSIDLVHYSYGYGDLNSGGPVPVVPRGQSITYVNRDAAPSVNTFHTLTGCKPPCNRSTGIAYPIANGPVDLDSGQLGFNNAFGAPAADRDTWSTPTNLEPGTYTFFCRVHPFMRGSFRVSG